MYTRSSTPVDVNYSPKLAGSVVFVVLFAISFLAHVQQAAWYKKRFTWLICVGAAWEVGAFLTRAISSHDPQNGATLQIANLLFLLAPIWITSYTFVTLDSILQHQGYVAKAAPIRSWFIGLWVVACLAQGTACGIMFTRDASTLRTAQLIYVGGVATQLALIAELAIGFCVAYRRGFKGFRRFILTCYFVLFFLTVRVVFRIVSYATYNNFTEPNVASDICELIMDAMPMWLALLLLNICHPGRMLFPSETLASNAGGVAIVDVERDSESDITINGTMTEMGDDPPPYDKDNK